MTRLELRRYNGQWQNRGVIERVRRTIAARVSMGECVLVDGEGVAGLTLADWELICGGFPADKVRVIRPGVRSLD
ncbi:MAG: hypothetical protein WDO13_06280 [Verrucomicrobiota bacterium]